MDRQEHRVERRLAAIFAADVAGYSRLMSQDVRVREDRDHGFQMIVIIHSRAA